MKKIFVAVPAYTGSISVETAQALFLSQMVAQGLGWDYSIAFHRLYEDLAMRFRVPLVPFLLVNIMSNPSLMQSDRAHPNRDGARAIAGLIWPSLEALLKKTA